MKDLTGISALKHQSFISFSNEPRKFYTSDHLLGAKYVEILFILLGCVWEGRIKRDPSFSKNQK